VSITTRGIAVSVEGKIIFIGPMLDKDSRSARAVAEIANHKGMWRPGSFVTAAMTAGAAWLFTRLGQEFVPILDEKNIVMGVKRIPSASLAQSQAMQFANENLISKVPQVAFVFSRSGTPDLAADPMPPSATDTYIMLKPRDEWPDPGLAKDDLIREISEKASRLPETSSISHSPSRCVSTS